MKFQDIKTVCVIGGGKMGRQIALNNARFGFVSYLTDCNADVCRQAADWAEEYLAGRVAKGRMTQEEVDAIKGRWHVVTDLAEAVKDADLVIEAIYEDENAKHEIFRQVNALGKKDAIVATNSSNMVSSLFAGDIDDPSRLANLHYFNPALVMEFVEVVKGDHTSEETAQALMDFAAATGKKPALMRKEIERFIANRIIKAIYDEAYWLVENGYCSFEAVDLACEKGLGHKMGPYRTKDLTGIDLTYRMMTATYETTGEKPVGYDLIKNLYDQGRLGKAVGHGFYDYE